MLEKKQYCTMTPEDFVAQIRVELIDRRLGPYKESLDAASAEKNYRRLLETCLDAVSLAR